MQIALFFQIGKEMLQTLLLFIASSYIVINRLGEFLFINLITRC